MITNDQRRRILIRHRPALPIHKFTRRKCIKQQFLLTSIFLLYFWSGNNKVNAFQFLDDPGNLPFFLLNFLFANVVLKMFEIVKKVFYFKVRSAELFFKFKQIDSNQEWSL